MTANRDEGEQHEESTFLRIVYGNAHLRLV